MVVARVPWECWLVRDATPLSSSQRLLLYSRRGNRAHYNGIEGDLNGVQFSLPSTTQKESQIRMPRADAEHTRPSIEVVTPEVSPNTELRRDQQKYAIFGSCLNKEEVEKCVYC